MKRSVLIFFLLLLFSFTASASIDKYADWVYEHDTISLDNNTYEFIISNDGKNLRVISDDYVYLITKQDCITNDNIIICYDNSSYDDNYLISKAYVEIKQKVPEIDAARTADQTVVEIGDEIDFKTTLSNNGDYIASDLTYIDSFPKEILIFDVEKPCYLGNDNSVIYKGDIDKDDDIICKYSIMPQNELNVKLKAQIDYYNGAKYEKIYSDLINIISNKIYDIDYSFNPSKPEIDQKTKLSINITNLISQNLKFHKVAFKLPSEITIDKTNLKIANNEISWEGTIDTLDTKELYLNIIPKYSGNYEILYDIDVEKISSKKRIEIKNNKIEIEVPDNDLEILSNLDDNNEFDKNSKINLNFWVQNPNNYTSIKNIDAKIASQLFSSQSIELDNLMESEKELLYKTIIIAPNLTSAKTYEVKLDLNYTLSNNIKKHITQKWNLIINPNTVLEISKKLSKASVIEQESVDVAVEITNKRAVPVYNIKLKEIINKSLSWDGKISGYIDSLDAGEKVTAYTYTITVPKITNQTDYEINTSLSYFLEPMGDGLTTEEVSTAFKAVTIKVLPKKISLNIKKEADKTKIHIGELVKVKYTIENKDTETAYNIKFDFTKGRNVDTIQDYDYFLERIEPGEVVSFEKELLRPKIAGNYKAGISNITFEDVDGNVFYNEIDTLSFDVLKRDIDGPAIIITKSYNKNTYYEDDIINATIKINNSGDTETHLKIADAGNYYYADVLGDTVTEFTFQRIAKQINNEGEVYAYYTYGSKQYRAYAASPKITILPKVISMVNQTNEIVLNNTTPEINETSVKKNIIIQFFEFIIGIFK